MTKGRSEAIERDESKAYLGQAVHDPTGLFFGCLLLSLDDIEGSSD